MANRLANEYADANGNNNSQEARRANKITNESEKLKITPLGGLNDVGEKT